MPSTKTDDAKVVPFDRKTQAAGRMASQASRSNGKTRAERNGGDGEPVPSNVLLPLASIEAGPNPRQMAIEGPDKELVSSIKKHGVLQPIRVRPIGKGRYQVVAGGRRFAAAKEAGLQALPVFIATPTDEQAFQQALVENLQRENLNPIDEAKAFVRLLAGGKLTQKQVGTIIGKSQSYVANALRLLETAPAVQEALESGKINVASAKAMASLPADQQERLVDRASKGEVNSKEIEFAAAEQKRLADQAERSRTEQEELVARISKALAEGRKAKTLTKGSTVTIDPYGVKTLDTVDVPAGLTLIYRDWNAHKSHGNGFECSCKAFALTFRYWDGEEKLAEFSRVCIVPAHVKAFQTAIDDEKRDREKAATAKVKALKVALEPNLTASATELSDEGWKLMCYSMMLGRPKEAAAFSKKQGVEHPKVDQYATSADPLVLWSAVEKAETSALVTWLSKMLVEVMVPDVYRMYAHEVARHVHVRQFLVDRFGLDAEFVYGGREKELQVGEYAAKEPTVADVQADADGEVPATSLENDAAQAEDAGADATPSTEAQPETPAEQEAGEPAAEEVAPEEVETDADGQTSGATGTPDKVDATE